MRRAPPVLLQARTRLACVKHAASVRSEPGSNSRLKLVAWRKKMPSDLHQRASLPSELLSLDLLRPFVLEKDEWFRTDSGTSYRLSKSSPPCPAERLTNTAYNSTRIRKECLTVNTLFVISTIILSERVSLFAFAGYGENRLTLSPHATIRLTAAKAMSREKTR